MRRGFRFCSTGDFFLSRYLTAKPAKKRIHPKIVTVPSVPLSDWKPAEFDIVDDIIQFAICIERPAIMIIVPRCIYSQWLLTDLKASLFRRKCRRVRVFAPSNDVKISDFCTVDNYQLLKEQFLSCAYLDCKPKGFSHFHKFGIICKR